MYAQVVVLTYQSPEIQTFTYEVPEELKGKIKIGQIVSVPFGKRNPAGIVLDTMPEIRNSKFEIRNLKKISNIILDQSLLLPHQIELLRWMAFYYHAPMVNCLEAMVPKLTNDKRLMINAITGSSNVKRSAFSVKQTLVLLPSINRIPETLARYPQAKNYIIYHAEQKSSERFNNWLKILSGNVNFIFGSRSTIFTPCPNLVKIIIFDEHEDVYKEGRSPYYDTLTIAEKLQELTKAKIEIIDLSPRIATYFNHKKEIINSHQNDKVVGPKVKIVSMISEKAAGNRSLISDIALEYLRYVCSKRGKSLLFLNKKAESGYFFCRSCKTSDFAKSAPDVCPVCKSADILFNSANISTLATIIQRLVPNASINNLYRGERSEASQRPIIDIATSSVFFKILPRRYDLVVDIATDRVLNISDFTSGEKLYAQISDLKKLTRSLLILQTFNPDNPVIHFAAFGEYGRFATHLLTERKALLYPPFALLVKLTIKGKREANLESRAQKLFDNLNSFNLSRPTDYDPLITIAGPYRTFFSKSLRYNILLKIAISGYDLKSRERARELAQDYLKIVSGDWQIVVEPDSIN